MKPLYIFLLSIILIHCQSTTPNTTEESEIAREIKKMLPEGEVMVDILDSIWMPPRMVTLSKKLEKAMSENPDWFMEQVRIKDETGKQPPYDARWGLTEQELKLYSELGDSIKAIPSITIPMEIIYNKNTITFKASGKLDFLNYYEINLDSNTVKVNGCTQPFKGEAKTDDKGNALQLTWSGYKWKFEEPENIDYEAIKNPENFNIKSYKTLVAKIKESGRTFFHITGGEIVKGVKTVGYELPLIIYKP